MNTETARRVKIRVDRREKPKISEAEKECSSSTAIDLKDSLTISTGYGLGGVREITSSNEIPIRISASPTASLSSVRSSVGGIRVWAEESFYDRTYRIIVQYTHSISAGSPEVSQERTYNMRVTRELLEEVHRDRLEEIFRELFVPLEREIGSLAFEVLWPKLLERENLGQFLGNVVGRRG